MASVDCLRTYKKIGHALADIVGRLELEPNYMRGLRSFIESRDDPSWWVERIGSYGWREGIASLLTEYERASRMSETAPESRPS